MPKLSFIYGPMNCGKTTKLLMAECNYTINGRKSLILKPTTDVRDGKAGHMTWSNAKSRFVKNDSKALYLEPGHWRDCADMLEKENPDVVFVDEVQFLYEDDIWFLSDIVDGEVRNSKGEIHLLPKPVLCYGLKTTAEGTLFEGSSALLAIMDESEETRGVCPYCGRRATMHIRVKGGENLAGADGVESEDVKYISVCRKCFKEFMLNKDLFRKNHGIK